MDAVDVLKYQEALVEKYHYRPLPPMFRDDAHKLYSENLPEGFCLEGADVPLYSPGGLRLCNRYNRVVIGDYGAYVEILPEDIINGNLMVKKGQEYRDEDARYAKHTKYSWLTARDGSDIKVYFQKKPVAYADYIPGRYYVSPFECSVSKEMVKKTTSKSLSSVIDGWLLKHGEFSSDLADYCEKKALFYSETFAEVLKRDLPPCEFEFWVRLNEVCGVAGGLSYGQYEAVRYHLDLIGCSARELNGQLPALSEEVRTAILLGLDEFPVLCEAECLEADTLRALLALPPETLLDVARFTKVLAGCKSEFMVADVQKVIAEAESRTVMAQEENKERELVF